MSAARLTPAGRGAIAVIEVRDAAADWNGGEPALFRSVNERPWPDQPVGHLLYGQWGLEPAEDVVVCRTDESSFEIHCHGGDAAVARILDDLGQRGIATVSAEIAAQRRGSVLECELRAALSQALTARTADLINEQLQLAKSPQGVAFPAPSPPSSGEMVGVRGRALTRRTDQAASEMEHAGERTAPSPYPSPPKTGERGPDEEVESIDALLSWADFGLHLTQPWQVVLTGRPNVGKSSLINALLGYQRAIVAEQPGTTRDVVTAVTAFDGWPVQLSDTAGLRATESDLEAAGIERARAALRSADLRMIVLDVGEPPTEDDWELLTAWPDAVVIAHKSDRADAWGTTLPAGALHVSSLTGAGLDELQRALVRRLVPRVPPPGTAIPITPRQTDELRRMRSFTAESASERQPG